MLDPPRGYGPQWALIQTPLHQILDPPQLSGKCLQVYKAKLDGNRTFEPQE